jgi:hypothetical protein
MQITCTLWVIVLGTVLFLMFSHFLNKEDS